MPNSVDLAALGLLDSVSINQVRAIRARTVRTATTRFSTASVYELIDALEAAHPGLMEIYLRNRIDSEKDPD